MERKNGFSESKILLQSQLGKSPLSGPLLIREPDEGKVLLRYSGFIEKENMEVFSRTNGFIERTDSQNPT